MGIKNIVKKVGDKAAGSVSRLSALSSHELEKIEESRNHYLFDMPVLDDALSTELTSRMLASGAVEIYNAYLKQINMLYYPIEANIEYENDFMSGHNIRYINITKWVTNKDENSLEKLINVYDVLSNENCNIALVFNRTKYTTNVYLAVVNLENDDNNVNVDIYKRRLAEAIKGNFPGSEINDEGVGIIPCLNKDYNYSVATATNVPAEKSEKFIAQTIEKLLDGIIPQNSKEEYTIILLATPIQDLESRKLRLSELYSALYPYSSWQTDYHFTDMKAFGSSATVGVNMGANIGSQAGNNNTLSESKNITDSQNKAYLTTNSESTTKGTSDSVNANISVGSYAGASVGVSNITGVNVGGSTSIGAGYSHGWNKSKSNTLARGVSDTLGKAVSAGTSVAKGAFASQSLGANFGANFARTSSVTATVGKNEGITQSHVNHTIKHALDLLDKQMERYEQCEALGMWDFAAYIISENSDIANNVAHSYLALTQGEESYMSQSAVNMWRGDLGKDSQCARFIMEYLKNLRHPLFGLNPAIVEENSSFLVYPGVVTATTALSGKELAYALNFPNKAVIGFPVLECAEFGRNVVTYDQYSTDEKSVELGQIFHMNKEEETKVSLSKQSLASHVFVTGSTGSGKSNTVYQIINEALRHDVKFLVVEPAKGEYKSVFGMHKNVSVFGTNPELAPLLKVNPFSFPKGIHVLEHLDRLVEIFNVCWPMYAAMPAVLKNAVEDSYVDCGWNLNTSRNKFGVDLYPTFKDVAANVKKIIESSEYDNESKGTYKGALLTRLQSLTNGINGMIFVQDEINSEDLFDENVIVDLSRVGSSETKSLIMGMLVLKLQEYRMTSVEGLNESLKHITVLEEAHNILKRTSTEQSSESPNLTGKSVEMISNAIAEMRTYGEGFVIVDQAPGLVDMSAIRNTNTKIIMRLPDLSDRELVGKAANLNNNQVLELAKLPCGVAAVYQNEWIQPVLCKVNRYGGRARLYKYDVSLDDIYNEKNEQKFRENLFSCIMNKEIFGKGRRLIISHFKDDVLNSQLDTTVKVAFMNYIHSNDENVLKNLKMLIYEFLQMEDVLIDLSKQNDMEKVRQHIVQNIEPSLDKYEKNQKHRLIMLLLLEFAERNNIYEEFVSKYTEFYKVQRGII